MTISNEKTGSEDRKPRKESMVMTEDGRFVPISQTDRIVVRPMGGRIKFIDLRDYRGERD